MQAGGNTEPEGGEERREREERRDEGALDIHFQNLSS